MKISNMADNTPTYSTDFYFKPQLTKYLEEK